METFIHVALLATHFLAILVLFCEIIYFSTRQPSRTLVTLILMLISTLIMLIGYAIELYATSVDAALLGAAVAYIGKPFALLTSLIFIANYCGKRIPPSITVSLGFLCSVFPVIVFTNGAAEGVGHHLYYQTVAFDIDRLFSPLVLTRGPLYFVYMAFLITMYATIIFVAVTGLKNTKHKDDRHSLLLLIYMLVSTLIGYAIYLCGITKGYDTTMTGTAIGSLFMTIAFFRYKMVDGLTLAKEQALNNAQTGLIVLNDTGALVYSNRITEELLQNTFSLKELKALEDESTVLQRNNAAYEIRISSIHKNGRSYGKTIEINDITATYNYNMQLQHDVEERTRAIHNIQRSVIASFAGIVEARDNSTGTHIKRMSKFVQLIAEELLRNGDYSEILSPAYIQDLVEVAPLHDIGKLSIPDSILCKPGKLTDEEFRIIQTHSASGAQIIQECLDGVERPEYVKLAKEVANFHHEKWNGSGYPNKLHGNDIPLCARIVAVADVYDAIRSERCYKPPMDNQQAKAVIVDGKGTHFDPTVVDAFLRILPEIEQVQ